MSDSHFPSAVKPSAIQEASSLQAMRPKRVKLSRIKGWKLPENTVIVSRPSRFGNPFIVGRPYLLEENGEKTYGTVRDNAHAAELFRRWLYSHRQLRERAAKALIGKNLACWCKLESPCHADVLLETANE